MAQVAPGHALAKSVKEALSLDPGLATWIADGRLLFGTYPDAKLAFDFGEERMAEAGSTHAVPVRPESRPAQIFDPVGGRNTGDYWLTVIGENKYYQSGKALLIGGLQQIEAARPGMLDQLATYKPRTKRVVARKPELLYEFPDQVVRFTAQLSPEWYVATNNSFREIKGYLRKAAFYAGLEWDKEVILKFHR